MKKKTTKPTVSTTSKKMGAQNPWTKLLSKYPRLKQLTLPKNKKVAIGIASVISVVLLVLIVAVGLKGIKYLKTNFVRLDGPAIISFSPESTTVTAGESQGISVMATTGGESISGFQFTIDADGNVPDDLSFEPEIPEGFQLLYNQRDGNTFQVVWIVELGSQGFTPFSSQDQITLGTFSFTGQDQGSLELSFDNKQTIITDAQSHENLANTPDKTTYTFAQ